MKEILAFGFLFLCSVLNAQDILINEFGAKNNHIIADPDFVQFADWIELFNPTGTNLNLNNYYITDDPENITKWQFPTGTGLQAQHYLVIWADDMDKNYDALHTNFKLSASEGWIGIYDQFFNLVHEVNYTDQFADISFGLENDDWVYFGNPTPGTANNTGNISPERMAKPVFSLSDGFYASNTTLEIFNPSESGDIHYTLDGSFPTSLSFIYNEPLVLTENTIVRAKVFGSKLPGPESTGTFFIDIEKDLPVVSLTIDPTFLWDFDIGIFEDSLIGMRKEWERFSNIKYFINEEKVFDVENDIRLFGATAFLLPQKSIAFFPDDNITYPLFNQCPVEEFESLVLRSSSDDWIFTMFKDGFIQTLVGQNLPIDYQAYQPTVMYINGDYFGIYNLREKLNEDYLKHHHNVDDDEIDLLKLNYWGYDITVLAGSAETYFNFLDFLQTNNLADDAVFALVENFLDLDNYTHYIITQIYIGNPSYKHNIKTWRKNTSEDGFKWLIYDTDRGYFDSSKEIFLDIYDNDTVLNRILENESYRNHFLQQTCAHINTTFRKSTVEILVDSLKSNIENEMPTHIQRWAPVGGIPSMPAWYEGIQLIDEFANNRKDTLLKRLNDFYSLDGLVNIQLHKSYENGGRVFMEGVEIRFQDSIHTFFKNVPLKLVAIPNPGYSFIGWEGISSNDSVVVSFSADTLLHAIFHPGCLVPEIITEDYEFTQSCSPYFIDDVVTVQNDASVFCEAGVELNFGEGAGFLIQGSVSFSGSLENPIVIKGEEEGTWNYIEVNGGELNLDHVHIYSGQQALKIDAESKVVITNADFYESSVNASDLISAMHSTIDIRNCRFFGDTNNTKKDGINCDSISSGIFNNNVFYNFSDDGINIGNNSQNVTLNGNQLFNCQGMGISVGKNSEAFVSRNIVSNCFGGIHVYTGAHAVLHNNTLYNNEVGVQAYLSDNTPGSGGNAEIVNTIFFGM